jgi:cytidine deaminase
MSETELIEAARNVRKHAHAPYSKFAVGAAILTKSGKTFVGCNVENVSFRITLCAEQAAVAAAVANGETDFVTVAVVTDSKEPVMPCGACRQVLAEFNPAVRVISANLEGRTETHSLSELLPRALQGILESLRHE